MLKPDSVLLEFNLVRKRTFLNSKQKYLTSLTHTHTQSRLVRPKSNSPEIDE